MVWSVERVTTPTLPALSPTPPSNWVPSNTEQGTEAIEDNFLRSRKWTLDMSAIFVSKEPKTTYKKAY